MKANTKTAVAMLIVSTSISALPLCAETLEKIAASNKITVSYRAAAVPFSYLLGTHTAVGFSVDLTEAIVDDVRKQLKRPDLKVEYIPVTGQDRIPLLVNGSYDLECGSTTNTSARGREVAFSINFFYTGTRLMTKKDSGVRNYGDLVRKPVASPAGSTNEKVLRKLSEEQGLGIQFVSGKDYAEALHSLENNQAVALALDDVLLFGLRANSEQPSSLEIVGDTLQVEPYACMVRKNDEKFKMLVDGTITRLMKTGEFSRLYKKWFQSPIPPRGAVLNMPMSDALRANLSAHSDKPAQ